METAGQPGFSILMVGNVRLSKDFDLRFTPGLIFGQRNLHYLVKDDATSNDLREHIMRIESTYASFPILLKYRSIRLNNYRPYIIAGVNYTFDLESEKKIRDDEKPKIMLNRNDICGIWLAQTIFPFSNLQLNQNFHLFTKHNTT